MMAFELTTLVMMYTSHQRSAWVSFQSESEYLSKSQVWFSCWQLHALRNAVIHTISRLASHLAASCPSTESDWDTWQRCHYYHFSFSIFDSSDECQLIIILITTIFNDVYWCWLLLLTVNRRCQSQSVGPILLQVWRKGLQHKVENDLPVPLDYVSAAKVYEWKCYQFQGML